MIPSERFKQWVLDPCMAELLQYLEELKEQQVRGAVEDKLKRLTISDFKTQMTSESSESARCLQAACEYQITSKTLAEIVSSMAPKQNTEQL